jgi:hypothetical protein
MSRKTRDRIRRWIRGIIGGAIGSGANGLTVMIADPVTFNPATSGGLQKLAFVMGISAAVGAALFLKQHPLPDEDEAAPTYALCPTCGRPMGISS